jgi:hypothetical protein
MKSYLALAAILCGSAICASASSHVVLSQPTAAAGSSYAASFRVTHGCTGSATTALRIEIPAEVLTAKPQAKSGWTITLEHEALATPVAGDGGRTITQRVSAITWTGGPLPDDEWDEFGISAKLPARTGPLSFPAVQTCTSGQVRWTEMAAPGQPRATHPAPMVTLTPAAPADDGMNGMHMEH